MANPEATVNIIAHFQHGQKTNNNKIRVTTRATATPEQLQQQPKHPPNCKECKELNSEDVFWDKTSADGIRHLASVCIVKAMKRLTNYKGMQISTQVMHLKHNPTQVLDDQVNQEPVVSPPEALAENQNQDAQKDNLTAPKSGDERRPDEEKGKVSEIPTRADLEALQARIARFENQLAELASPTKEATVTDLQHSIEVEDDTNVDSLRGLSLSQRSEEPEDRRSPTLAHQEPLQHNAIDAAAAMEPRTSRETSETFFLAETLDARTRAPVEQQPQAEVPSGGFVGSPKRSFDEINDSEYTPSCDEDEDEDEEESDNDQPILRHPPAPKRRKSSPLAATTGLKIPAGATERFPSGSILSKNSPFARNARGQFAPSKPLRRSSMTFDDEDDEQQQPSKYQRTGLTARRPSGTFGDRPQPANPKETKPIAKPSVTSGHRPQKPQPPRHRATPPRQPRVLEVNEIQPKSTQPNAADIDHLKIAADGVQIVSHKYNLQNKISYKLEWEPDHPGWQSAYSWVPEWKFSMHSYGFVQKYLRSEEFQKREPKARDAQSGALAKIMAGVAGRLRQPETPRKTKSKQLTLLEACSPRR